MKDWAGVATLRYRSDLRDAPLRPTALHGRRGGGHTSSKFIAIWILNVLADTTHRMEKQKQYGQKWSFKKLQTPTHKDASTKPFVSRQKHVQPHGGETLAEDQLLGPAHKNKNNDVSNADHKAQRTRSRDASHPRIRHKDTTSGPAILSIQSGAHRRAPY